ncbi:MAG: hypothetical protein WCS15_00060 [Prevotella sp.]|nr:hypothetical protein [Massilibacteroides sp.]
MSRKNSNVEEFYVKVPAHYGLMDVVRLCNEKVGAMIAKKRLTGYRLMLNSVRISGDNYVVGYAFVKKRKGD